MKGETGVLWTADQLQKLTERRRRRFSVPPEEINSVQTLALNLSASEFE